MTLKNFFPFLASLFQFFSTASRHRVPGHRMKASRGYRGKLNSNRKLCRARLRDLPSGARAPAVRAASRPEISHPTKFVRQRRRGRRGKQPANGRRFRAHQWRRIPTGMDERHGSSALGNLVTFLAILICIPFWAAAALLVYVFRVPLDWLLIHWSVTAELLNRYGLEPDQVNLWIVLLGPVWLSFLWSFALIARRIHRRRQEGAR